MSDRFQPGQVWEIRDELDDTPYFTFLLLEKLPSQNNVPWFGVSFNVWEILVLYATGLFEPAGTRTKAHLDDIHFPTNKDVGYSGYDTMYVRLA